MKLLLLFIAVTLSLQATGQVERSFRIEKQYLNFPVEMNQDRQKMVFTVENDTLMHSVIRLAQAEPDYFMFKDVSALKGKTLTISFDRNCYGIQRIYQSDQFDGEDSVYQESNRPQLHFSSRRGWNNDPNGLVYHDGEYHLFYQHNPYEINWENMHWGHAVSTDLLHWEELPDALHPDKLGHMFSGSAVIDKNNTSGWGKDALVAAYTAHGKTETQCVAYSLDNGRTFTKYSGNPVIINERYDNPNSRDPKVKWYEPNKEWVMVLFEYSGISFFTSKNLKEWKFESHLTGFWECPELFELPVDGDPDNTLWVAYGASGTYMLGDFNGKTFTPKFGKYKTTYGNQYAAQTFNNTPDSRRIQIGWGTIKAKGMNFNQMMCFPTELTLRSTNEGVRLFSAPIDEIEKLHSSKLLNIRNYSLEETNQKLKSLNGQLLHIRAEVELTKGASCSLKYNGNNLVTMSIEDLSGVQTPMDNPGKLVFDFEIIMDRTSVEVYFFDGKLVQVKPLEDAKNQDGFKLEAQGNEIIVHSLEVFEMESIW